MTVPNTTLYANGPVDDQVEIYDTAVLNWLIQDYAAIIPGKAVQVLIASPHRGYMDVVTQQFVDQTAMTFPRIALTRMDYERDPSRFNCNTIRKLGKVGTGLSKVRQEQFPVPIDIPYQVDFLSEFAREMNLWVQKFIYQFGMAYKYLTVHIDDVWQNKMFPMMLEGGLRDASELETDNKPRYIRRVGSFISKCWLFGQGYREVPLIKRVLVEVSTTSTDGPVDETFSPQSRQPLYTTLGGQTVFTGASLRTVPVLENTLIISAKFGGTEQVVQDDGNGALFGPNVASGTINYTTGAVDITFSTAPDAGILEAFWLMDVEA